MPGWLRVMVACAPVVATAGGFALASCSWPYSVIEANDDTGGGRFDTATVEGAPQEGSADTRSGSDATVLDDSRVQGDSTLPTDADTSPRDTLSPAIDTSSPPKDTSSPPTDTYSPPPDTYQPPLDNRIWPIAIGRTWNYRVSPADAGTEVGCYGDPTATFTGTGTTYDAGQSLVGYEVCGSFLPAEYVANGDVVRLYYNIFGLVEYLMLDAPVTDGRTWDYGAGTTARWAAAGTVTVPAGTFPDCWRWQTSYAESGYVIYCRGVGPVRKFVPGTYDAVLISKNF